jgi:xylan 1,4-beta-xylosidase
MQAVTPTESRVIDADLAKVRGTFDRKTDLCVGAGRANEGLRADWQHQLAEVQRECGFRYLRFHGLLSDDMGVYQVDKNGHEIYNWQYIDALFDALLGMGVRPFVELGFMPSALASGSQTIFWWKGNVTPPKDPAKWEALIKALTAHWTERYGEDEVARWYFEVWNEPNLSSFWIGDKGGRSDADFEIFARKEYFKLYAITARAVKAVSQRYRVGGPATAGNAWIPEMIAFCSTNNIPIDFISTHHYAVMSGYLDESGNAGTVFSPNRETMTREIKTSRAQIASSPKPGLELHYTEWSTSYTPFDPLHDSYHSASFILNKLKGVGDAAQSMSYWTFTDIFEEAGPRVTPFHGGFGLLNYQGIRKASFFAYQFVHRLGDNELETTDSDAWVCADDKGGVQALFWDFTITHPGPTVINQEYYKKDLPADQTRPAKLCVRGLQPGKYALKAYKVGYRSNDAYTAYLDMGSPGQLTRSQVAKLKNAGSGEPYLSETVEVGAARVFDRIYAMRQNDVVFVVLTKL